MGGQGKQVFARASYLRAALVLITLLATAPTWPAIPAAAAQHAQVNARQSPTPTATEEDSSTAGTPNQPIAAIDDAGSAGRGYTARLLAPTTPGTSDTFTWRVDGSRPTAQEQIAFVLLSGCWPASQIAHVKARGTGDVNLTTTVYPTLIRIGNVRDTWLPMTVTVTFTSRFAATTVGTDITVKTDSNGDWDDHADGDGDALILYTVGGPVCAQAPTSSPTLPPIPTITPTATSYATSTGTATPSRTNTWTSTPTGTSAPAPTSTVTPSLPPTTRPSLTPTNTVTHAPTQTLTPTATSTGAPNNTPTSSPTGTDTATATPTRIAATSTDTDTPEPSQTGSETATTTPAHTGTDTNTPEPSQTASETATTTSALTTTPTPTQTGSDTATTSPTDTGTATPTTTSTPASTTTSVTTDTSTATSTGTDTETPAATSTTAVTDTPTPSQTGTDTATATSTAAATDTDTSTATDTATDTATADATPTPPYVLPGGLVVSVAYADGSPDGLNFPRPWAGAPDVIFVGNCTSGVDCDTGAIRIDNHTPNTAVLNDVSVAFPNPTYGLTVLDPWLHPTGNIPSQLPLTIPAGKTVILASVNGGDFDTSDDVPSLPNPSCTSALPPFYYPPVVTVSLGDGSKTSLFDTGHIVDDGGGNTDCVFAWHPMGTTGVNAQGTTVTLQPLSASQQVQKPESFTANVADVVGASPQVGVTVNFNAISGPNAGVMGQAITDDLGNATFSYTSTLTGLDTVVASVQQAGAIPTITSNTGTVQWVTQLFGTLSISPLFVGLHRGSQQKFIVTAADSTGSLVPNTPVTLTITGPNAQQLSATTNSAGVATFSYVNRGIGGTDTVQAGATIGGGAVTSNPVTVPWDALIEVNADTLSHGSVRRYDGVAGNPIDTLLSTGAVDLGIPLDAIVGPDGNLYLSNAGGSGDPVLRFDGATLSPLPAPGQYGSTFVAAGSSALSVNPGHIVFGPDGNLFLLDPSGGAVYRFKGSTGVPLPAPGQSGATFVPAGSGGLASPYDLVFGRDDNLYITDFGDNVIRRYDGTTGAPLPAAGQSGAVFVPRGSGGLLATGGIAVGLDGNLYVSDFDLSAVLRYSGTTGDPLPAPGKSGAIFVDTSSVVQAESLAFGPDGNLYVDTFASTKVDRFDGTTGAPLPAPGQTGAVFISTSIGSFFTASSIAFSGPDVAPSFVPTSTPIPTITLTSTPTSTGTNTPSVTPTGTPTSTLTPSDTPTGTLSPSATPTASGTAANTSTPTSSPTGTRTPTSTPTATAAPTLTATPSATLNPNEHLAASITSPTSAQQVSGKLPIIGSAGVSGGTLAGFTLAYASLGSSVFTTFVTGTSTVSNGTLGTLDTTSLRDGQYTLRLQVSAIDGKTVTFTGPTISVLGRLKVGNLQFTVPDLSVSVTGIPIVVNRSFDNFLRTQGDFGVNWTEATASGSATEDTCLGNITVQLPISNQPMTFNFNPGDTGQNIDGFELFAPAWSPDPTTGATLADINGASTGLASGVDTSAPQCWFDLFNNFSPYAPAKLAVTTTDGTVFKITANVADGLTEVDTPGGNDKLTYASSGVTSTRGPAVQFSRDSQGRITKITDPAGKTILYGYDSNGDLATVTDENGGVTTYHYDSNHDLLGETDPTGRSPATALYNAQGQLTSITDINGKTTTFNVNLNTHQQVITDARGNHTTNIFDDFGDVTQSTDPLGNTTSYTYDPTTHKPLTATDPLGHTTSMAYNTNGDLTQDADPLGNTTSYQYDAQHHLLSQSFNGKTQSTLTYTSFGSPATLQDAMGNTTNFSYVGNSVPSGVTYPNGSSQFLNYVATGVNTYSGPNNAGTTYTRDPLGRVTASTTLVGGGKTAVTSYTYDAAGNMLTTTDPQGGVTTNTYDAAGRLLTTTDPRGNTSSYSYDALGQLVQTVYPDGSTAGEAYDANGNLVASIDQNGRTTQYIYDADNRLVETDYPDGSKTSVGYDAAGRKISSTDGAGDSTTYSYDSANRLTKVTDPLGNSISYGYDPVTGDRTTVTDPAGHVTTYTYDAGHHRTGTSTAVTIGGVPTTVTTAETYSNVNQLASVTDPLGRLTSYAYDPSGNLSRVRDPITNTNPLYQGAIYGYDANGNLNYQNDDVGNVTKYSYDLNNNLTGTTYPDGAAKSYTYDAAGNLATTTNARGQVTTYSYDTMNRVSTIAYPDHTVTYTYYSGGQRKTMGNQQGGSIQTTSYAIDTMGRITTITEPGGSTLQYTYDGAGRRTSLTTLAGTTSYQYDAAGRLIQVVDPAHHTTAYGYDSRGNLAQRTLPNGVTTVYSYDELNRLVSLTTTGPGNVQIWQDLYTIDAAGQRTSVQETDQTGALATYTYSYDADGRLTHEQQSRGGTTLANTAYTYDLAGNRLTRVDDTGTTTSRYNSRGEMTSQTGPGGTTTETYDADGNLLSSANGSVSTSYSYDSQNQLLSVSSGSSTTSYTYDGDGNRTTSTTGGTITTYLVDPNGLDGLPQVVETTQSGGPTVDYVYGNERISMDQGAGALSYYLYDGNQNTRLLAGSAGTVQNSYRYDAFGNLLASTGTVPNPFLYGGQQFDAGVGLYYLRARYMDPTQGRFLSEDPMDPTLKDPLTLHRYLYARDNPVSLVDPSGLDFTLADLSVAQVVDRIATASTWLGGALTALGKGLSIGSTITKIQSAGAETDTVSKDVDVIYGTVDVPGAVQSLTKLTACKAKFTNTSAQGLEDLLCSQVSTGLLTGLIDLAGVTKGITASAAGDTLLATGLNLPAVSVILVFQSLALEWTAGLPRHGNYRNDAYSNFTIGIASLVLGNKLADLGLTIAGVSAAEDVVSTAKALSSGLKTLSTVEAMILAPLAFTVLEASTLDDNPQ